CFMGWETSAAAAACGAVPCPASLLYIPRFTPQAIAVPATAPKVASALKADLMISAMMVGTSVIFRPIITNAMIIYAPAIKGTTYSATLLIRFTPPIMIMANKPDSNIPVNTGDRPKAVSAAVLILLLWTLDNRKPVLAMVTIAKVHANVLFCSPLSI